MSRHESSADRPAEPVGEPLDPQAEPDADALDASGPSAADEPREPGPVRVKRRANRLTIPPGARRPAILATIALVVTALVAGLFAWGSRPAGDGIASASNHPSGSTATSSVGPSPTSGPVESYQPIPGSSVAPVARLTARGASGPIVPLDAAFRLESTTDVPAATLVERLTVDPAVALTTVADPAGHAADLTPRTPLVAGTVYRFSLHGATGELVDSWAFQAKQPLRIVGTLPGDRENSVPINTGIEFTFDQDGVVDAASHVSVSPATPGRFEEHGRTLAFVPDQPLKPSTVYTVTVTRGIAASTTGEATIADTRFEFETVPAGPDQDFPLTFVFPSALTESPTADRPTIGIWAYGGNPDVPPTTVGIQVYRLAGLDAAVAAYRSLQTRPSWTRFSTEGLVATTGLTRVVNGALPLRTVANSFWVELPDPLPTGWYLVETRDGASPAQAVLQVSDVAGFLAVSATKTVVWANDVHSGDPITGGTATVGPAVLGVSDSHGLISAPSPAALLPATGSTCSSPCDPVVTLTAPDGRSIFLPASTGSDRLYDAGGYYYWDGDPDYWSTFRTDRWRYRSGDTVNVWGMARNRNSGAAPAEVTLRLTASDDQGNDSAPALLTRALRVQASGAFAASFPLGNLPDGSYELALYVGTTRVRTTAFVVGPIAKPAYSLSVATGRRVYLAHNRIGVTVTAQFYEGTPVPGVPIRVAGFGETTATTGASGTASVSLIASVEAGLDQPQTQQIEAVPSRAEEAEIGGASDTVVVFPSSRTVDATAAITGGQVRARGSLHLVAVNRLERALADGASIWDLDPRGAAVAAAAVKVTFVELIPKRTEIGSQYDFVEKKVVARYETELVEHPVKTVTVRTNADGAWSAAIPASVTDNDYRIQVSSADPQGRVARSEAYADRTVVGPDPGASYPALELSSGDRDGTTTFRVGDRVDVTMSDPSLAQTSGDGTTYLFLTAQRGIRAAAVQASRRYSLTFPKWGPPNVSIGAVRFTGRTYVGVSWYSARFRVTDRRLDVDLTATASRYAPGQTATVLVRTRNAAGRPVPATVVLRAIDEKLFTIGAAAADDPLNELYAGVGDGIRATYLSHQYPHGQPEGGDTTGGGGDDRDNFQDSLLFETITTDANGRGQVRIPLSDDLTSWRVTGSAITRNLEAGVGTVLLPVGLPFFVDASIAPEYLVADRPSIPVRTFGSGLAKGQAVTIRVTSSTLGFDSGPLPSKAFATLDVPLPALRAGVHKLTLSATTGSGDGRRSDSMTRTFAVTETRLTALRSAHAELPIDGRLAGGATGFTSVVVSDAGPGRYDALLDDLGAGGGARLDRALAADLARDLLGRRTGNPDATPSDGPRFDPARYTALDDGLSLVPYASSDLELSALVAIVAPDRIDRTKLAFYLTSIRANAKETRERRSFAIAGLAGLGEPVLPALQADLSAPDLTVRERLFLGLGAAALGDGATARGVLAALVSASGEQAGQLARLRVGSSAADITEATALASVLAADLGDPLATHFWAYVEANPAVDRIEVLPAVAFVRATLDHLATEPAAFAWTLDGERHVVTLERGESWRMIVTPQQLAGLRLEPVTGSTAVTTSWREPTVATARPVDPDMTIARTVHPPTGTIKSADLVVVELKVTFSAQAAAGCREVTELVPSGLAPVGATGRWYDPANGEDPPDGSLVLPYDQSGSRVSFCVGPQPDRRAFTLRYVARVVSPGTYAWEPAIAQAGSGDGPAAVIAAGTLTIE
jgi:hypothetical protein